MKKIKSPIILLFLIATSSSIQSQEVKINSNFIIEADGTFRSDNAASTWDDIMAYPEATTRGNSPPPY